MPLFTISTAARAVKRSRGTIHNYLKSGRLSFVIDNDGNRKIDTSELLRVFGELSMDSIEQPVKTRELNSVEHPKMPSNDTQNAIVEILKEQLQAALDREKVLLETLQQEQRSRREIEQRLLALPEGVSKKPGLFARLFR